MIIEVLAKQNRSNAQYWSQIGFVNIGKYEFFPL